MLSDRADLLSEPNPAVMWSPLQVAERDGVSKQAVARKARQLAERHGLTVERDTVGRIKKFNVVQYDQLRGKLDDPAHRQAGKAKPAPASAVPAADSYDEARRQNAWLDAERSRLALDEARGRLVPVDGVRDAISAAGDAIAAVIDRLPNAADDLAAIVGRDGAHGARVELTKEAARLRTEIAAALRNALGGAPADQGGDRTTD